MGRSLSNKDAASIEDLLGSMFGRLLVNERFKVIGTVEPGFVEIITTIEKRDGSSRYDIYIRAPLAGNSVSAAEARNIALDFLGHYLDQYFEAERDLFLPVDYQPYPIGDKQVFARGDLTNPKLDRMADEIIEEGVPLEPDDPRHGTR